MGALARAFKYWPGKLSRLLRRQAPLFIGAGVLIGLVVAGTITLVLYLYDRGAEQATSSAVNLSYVISYHTNRSLQSVSLAVSDVVERLRYAGVNSISDLQSVGESKDVQAMLRNRATETPSIDGLFIVGVNGAIGAHLPYGVSESEYMDYLRDAAPGSVYLSTPFQSMGTWRVGFSKRISARDGAFLGAVTGLVNLATFNALFDKVVFGEHGSLFILRTDGALVAWYPQSEMAFGSNVSGGRLLKDFISKHRDGVLRQKNGFDGMDRMFAVANSPNFPVATVVAVSMNDIVADWVRQTEGLAFAAGVIVFSIIAGLIRLADRLDQLSDAREREAVQAQLAIQYRRFNNAMENIVQGVALYDRDNTLIACNKRYAEIYGLPDKLTKPGATRTQILKYLGDQGFGKVSGQPRREADGSILIIAELSDGRVIAQRKKGLADGGSVSTYEDISRALPGRTESSGNGDERRPDRIDEINSSSNSASTNVSSRSGVALASSPFSISTSTISRPSTIVSGTRLETNCCGKSPRNSKRLSVTATPSRGSEGTSSRSFNASNAFRMTPCGLRSV